MIRGTEIRRAIAREAVARFREAEAARGTTPADAIQWARDQVIADPARPAWGWRRLAAEWRDAAVREERAGLRAKAEISRAIAATFLAGAAWSDGLPSTRPRDRGAPW